MRKTVCSVATMLALLAGGITLAAGTAQAATPIAKTSCLNYTWVPGQGFVTTSSGCTTSSTGTSGTSSGGTTSGTGTNGTTINNCNTGCTATATGTAGKSWWPW